MISSVVPFYSIIESVKDETGIQNLRPYYDKIRRLIFRAEKIIGYGGSVRLKKKVYETEGVYFKYPDDFIELEGVGSCCNPIPACDIRAKEEGFKLKNKKSKVVLIYWGLQVDEEGNPITTTNHEEAVISFIVWKLYSARVFLGLGNFNLKKDYEYIFNSEVGRARGNDAFPTIEEYSQMSEINSIDRRLLFKFDPLRYNYCDDSITEDCSTDSGDNPVIIYYWQEPNLQLSIEDIVAEYNEQGDPYIENKPSRTEQEMNSGSDLSLTIVGRLAFAIKNAANSNWSIFDVLGNDVTSIFVSDYVPEGDVLFFYSQSPYTPATMFLKIKRN